MNYPKISDGIVSPDVFGRAIGPAKIRLSLASDTVQGRTTAQSSSIMRMNKVRGLRSPDVAEHSL